MVKNVASILSKWPMADLYNSKAVGDGDTSKSSEYIVAASEWLCANGRMEELARALAKASEGFRKASYNAKHVVDPLLKTRYDFSGRMTEDRIARLFVGYDFPYIGHVFDYQVPLKDVKERKGSAAIGKIDLVSRSGRKTYLLEFKLGERSRDSLLHAALEVCTYFNLLKKEKFLRDYTPCCPGGNFVPCVLVFVQGRQYAELMESSGGLAPLGDVLIEMHRLWGLEVVAVDRRLMRRIADYEAGVRKFPLMGKRTCKSIIPLTQIVFEEA